MGRKASDKPWLQGATGWWCATLRGKRVYLDKDYRVACRKLKILREQEKRGEQPDKRDWLDSPFRILAAAYLEKLKGLRKPATYRAARYDLVRAGRILPKTLRVSELGIEHLDDLVAAMQEEKWGQKQNQRYSPSTIRDTITTLQGVLNWAVRTRKLDENPLRGYVKPRGRIRRRPITWPEFHRLLRKAGRNFRQFLIAQRLTGCRSGEVAGLLWQWVDLEEGFWIIPDHKTVTTEKEPKPRMIPLPDHVLRMCKRLAKKPHHPNGHVFLNQHGRPYTKDCLVRNMDRLRKRAGIGLKGGERIVLHSNRVSFATEASPRVSAYELAKLLGHTDVRTTFRYTSYSREHLREIQSRAQGGAIRVGASSKGVGQGAVVVVDGDGSPHPALSATFAEPTVPISRVS